MKFGTDLRPMSILIPDENDDLDTVKILRCLSQARELTVHILSTSRSPSVRFSRYCAHLHHHSSQNDDDWIDAIERIVQQWKIDVLLPVTLRGVQLISQRREAISKITAIPPIPKFELLEQVRNKWWLYKFAKQKGLPVIPSVFVGKRRELISDSLNLDSIEFPALLKPTSLRSGLGIVKVGSSFDLNRALKNKRIIEGADYILQSYVPGVDFSFSVFCKSGEVIAYTLWKELLQSKEPFCVPQLVEFTDDKDAVNLGKQLVSAIGWDGVADIDFIFDKRDQMVKILEVNPRFWQSVLGCLIAGVNFPLLACLSAVGEECLDMKQICGVRYARPAASVGMMLHRFVRREQIHNISWRDSVFRLICNDPLPELIYYFRRIAGRLRRAYQ